MFASFLLSLLIGSTFSCSGYTSVQLELHSSIEIRKLPKSVCKNFGSNYDALNFKILKDHRNNHYVEGKNLSMRIGEIQAGRLSVEWYDEGKRVRSLWLAVEAKKKAWVYAKSVSFGKKIRRSDVSFEVVNIAHSLGTKTLVSESPKGMVAKKRSRKGQLIDESMIGIPALVSRNDSVKVIVKKRGLTIESKGTALSTGWLAGDLISVKVSRATEIIRAKVVGVKEVHVEI